MNELLLLSGLDIPFPEAGISIHQPTMKELALMGEDRFFSGLQLLNFSKENLTEQDKTLLGNQNNFDIIMSIIRDNSLESRSSRVNVMMLFTFMFPEYRINIDKNEIFLASENNEEEVASINRDNYESFLKIVNAMFCNMAESENEYKAGNAAAQKLIDKFKNRQKKLAELKKENEKEKVSVFGRFISILAVGEHKDINSFFNYTVFQLMDEYQRFELKEENDIYLKAKIAGATGMNEVDNWMKDLHPNI